MLPVILAIRNPEDRDFVARVYEKYKKNLYYVANDVLNHDDDAKDCVQETVVILIDKLQDYQTWDIAHQRFFLFKCCKNFACGMYNRKKKIVDNEFSMTAEDGSEIDIADESSDVEKLVLSEYNVKRILKIIEEMDEKYGDLLFFKFYANMKNIEIAEKFNIPINTVNGRLARARKILLERLKEECYELSR